METVRSQRRRGFTLVELLVVIVIIGILAGLLLPVIAQALFRTKVANCAHNLSQLYKVATVYATANRGKWPSDQGGALWLRLKETQPPMIEPGHEDVLACPAREEPLGVGETHYRGPNVPLRQIGAAGPLGADREDNHGPEYGGNVLLKDGSVQEHKLDSTVWTLCATDLAE